jgi:cytolysin (calcineurin-like family phosphatase)
MEKFTVFISSDPQYPWYDEVLPTGLKTQDEIKENSNRQITQRYESMNLLALQAKDSGSEYQVKGVLINGDLTAFGHDWQYDKYKEQVGILNIPYFPGLGNHDYANNVDDTYNNNAASRMVDYMYGWLKLNAGILNYDFSETSYYKFPELRTDYSGSLSYSFNIDLGNNKFVHFVQLQNFPSYENEWNSWNAGSARRDFYYIKPSFYWLRNDLAISRNRGDIIIVSLHDYHDNFTGPDVAKFNDIMVEYGVSAVFAGHIHPDCGQFGYIGNSNIPFFRSGSASYQDYLVADIDTTNKKMLIKKIASAGLEGVYLYTGDQWEVALNNNIPSPPLPVPPTQGYVTFLNEGGFVAKFHLEYDSDGNHYKFDTGNMDLGNKKTYDIPPYATNVWVWAEEKTGLVWDPWKTVFDLRFSSPPNNCFKLYGTTLHPKWNNNCS